MKKNKEIPLKFSSVDAPSLEAAQKLAGTGKWAEAANHYYALGLNIDVAQQLINLGKFKQATDILESESTHNPTPLNLARIEEKLGWIDDYFGRFAEEITHFENAVKLLPAENPQMLETCVHFQGRAHVALASQGKHKALHLAKARTLFEKNLKFHKDNIDSGMAFQHTWLARCDILEGKFKSAMAHISKAQNGFEGYLAKNPKSGIMAQYERILGLFYLYKKDYKKARTHFRNAIKIHKKTDNYLHGIAEALIGISDTYQAEGDSQKTNNLRQEAQALSPQTIFYPHI